MTTSTVQIKASDGWQQVAAAGEDFLIEITAPGELLLVRLADAEPAAGAPGHRITTDAPFVRAGLTGAAWIRTPSPHDLEVIVST